MESRQSKEREGVLALKKEQADIAQRNDLLRMQEKDLLSSVEDLKARSKIPPSEYTLVEKEHLHRMKEMENDVVQIVLKKDKMQSDFKNLQESYSALQKEFESTSKNLNTLNKEVTLIILERDNVAKELEEYKVKSVEILDSKRKELTTINSSLREKKDELQLTISQCAALKKEIERESNVLAIKRSDIEIYEARLRRKFPNEVFILSK